MRTKPSTVHHGNMNLNMSLTPTPSARVPHSTDGFIVRRACPELAEGVGREDASTTDALWQAVLSRDRAADGTFVYGVASTRIFCRPSCPSRRPRPGGVHFFDTPREAEQAGFRPCHRCRPQDDASPAAAWLAACRDHLDSNRDRRVTLDELARFAGVSASHLQRAFQREFGLSPRAYQAARRTKQLAATLPSSATVTDALYSSGYNSPAAAYAQARSLGMPPAALRKSAATEAIVFAIVPTKLGKLLAAATAKGLCRVAFAETSGSLSDVIQEFRQAFAAASICKLENASASESHAAATTVLRRALPVLQALAAGENAAAIPVDLRGTAFQQKVWRALRRIPRGKTRSYSQLAAQLGQPTAARAVARACATNSVALAVPCHRVNAADGSPAGYRWGVARKQKLQAAESRRDSLTSQG